MQNNTNQEFIQILNHAGFRRWIREELWLTYKEYRHAYSSKDKRRARETYRDQLYAKFLERKGFDCEQIENRFGEDFSSLKNLSPHSCDFSHE